MAINPYYRYFDYQPEQALVQELITETIQIYGHEVSYLPRRLVDRDRVFNEDPLSMFDRAFNVEVYVRDVDGFSGEGDVLARFGFAIRDEITFTVSRKRWEEMRNPKLLTETGLPFLRESTDLNRYITNNARLGDHTLEDGDGGILLEDADDPMRVEERDSDLTNSIVSSRPLEGDLIHFPLVDKIFEIKFVQHEQIFYQTGALQTYDLRCELWEYSSERLETNDGAIDSLANELSLDELTNDLLNVGDVEFEANTSPIGLEDDSGDVALEEVAISNVDRESGNEDPFEERAPEVLDFSEANPFV